MVGLRNLAVYSEIYFKSYKTQIKTSKICVFNFILVITD